MTWALRTAVDLDEANLHISALEAAGLLGLVEEQGRVTAYFDQRTADLPLDGEWEHVADQDWNAVWKEGIEPVTVGAVTATPPWIDVAGALVIEPAMAFGTGHHETTAGCLAALQEEEVAGRSVLDVGTGTGLLALAARQLGADPVVGVDNDPEAVDAARLNAERNGLDIDIRLGSVEAVDGTFDIVLANLDTATLTALAPGLAERTARHGRLVVSGVSIDRIHEAVSVLASVGMQGRVREGREWVVIVAAHEPAGDE